MLVTTAPFARLADEVAGALGRPDTRVAVVEHPLGGIDDDAVTSRAESIVERLVVLFTT